MTTVAIALIMSFALPAGAGAKSGDDHERAAQKQCKEERGKSPATREAFAEKYGTNGNKRNAFGKCVSGKARGR